jgi:hypothetical protein
MREANLLTSADYALFRAIETKNTELVKQSLAEGASLFARDPSSVNDLATPMHLAVKFGSIDIMDILYDKAINSEGAEMTDLILNEKDKDGSKPIHWAVDEKQENALRWLVGKGVSVESLDKEGYTPFHWAIFKGDFSMASCLVNLGADPNAAEEDTGRNSFHMMAAAGRDTASLIHLRRYGCNINARDFDDNTPAHLAPIWMMEEFFRLGADLSIKNATKLSVWEKISETTRKLQEQIDTLKSQAKGESFVSRVKSVSNKAGLSYGRSRVGLTSTAAQPLSPTAAPLSAIQRRSSEEDIRRMEEQLELDREAQKRKEERNERRQKLVKGRDVYAADQRRIINAPGQKVIAVRELLSDAIINQLVVEARIFRNASNMDRYSAEYTNSTARGLRIFGALTNIIPTEVSVGPAGVTVKANVGAAIEKTISLAADIDEQNARVVARKVINFFSQADNDDEIRKWYEAVIKPAVNIIVRNYEYQILRIRQQDEEALISGMTNRIFNAIGNMEPRNHKLAPVHSFLNDAAERICYALYLGGESSWIKTRLITEDGKRWTLDGLITKPRIRVVDHDDCSSAKDEVYVSPHDNHNGAKYGERWGTPGEANKLSYVRYESTARANEVAMARGGGARGN